METAKETDGKTPARDYRYARAKRKNNPPAGLAAQGRIAEQPCEKYFYNPHLPPVLRFDPTGSPDRMPDLLEEARHRPLTADEVRLLADALRNQEPWLEWSGKREKRDLEVDAQPLHIHERVSAKAILAVAARQDVQRSFFADPQQEYRDAVRFYQYDVDWSNRLILGDSLVVMASLARREDMAGKVQMIYMDPPYGIKFSSNFQPRIGQRSVADKPADLTREPEVVKAYRDTWTLGIHSYLTYLRDRLLVARELLADSGSIFVQIGDENVHLVRQLLDEIFGRGNFVSLITVQKMAGLASELIKGAADYILFYAKDRQKLVLKFHTLFHSKVLGLGHGSGARYDQAVSPVGERRPLPKGRDEIEAMLDSGWEVYQPTTLTTFGSGASSYYPVEFRGRTYFPSAGKGWLTTPDGIRRLSEADRIVATGEGVRFSRRLNDFPNYEINNVWADIASPPGVVYVVQTSTALVQRCMLMTTDPGDLVLDPTCVRKGTRVWSLGSGHLWWT